ncbi:MAG: glycosyltransferase family 9 protein [Candidatus Binatia bacterium]
MRLDPHRILIVLHGSVGDVARALPVANHLRDAYPNATIAWAIEPAAFPLVEHHPAVDETIVFDRGNWQKSVGPFLRQIRRAKFDLVLDLQRLLKSGFISWWSGAPYRLGFHRQDAKEGNWLFNNQHILAAGSGVSKLQQYLKFTEHLGIQQTSVRWGLRLTRAEDRQVDQLLGGLERNFAAYFVGSRWESKQWFPAETAKCAAEVRRRYGLAAVLLGTKEDAAFARRVEQTSAITLLNLVGRTSLREAVGVLRRAAVAVGPDTGLMHVSAAVGTPVVSLWGATSPERTGPHGSLHLVIRGKAPCSPCYLRHCPIGRICMESIDVDEVAGRVGEALSQRSAKHDSGF